MADLHDTTTAPADADAQAYMHGHMEVREQVSTYGVFLTLAKWGSLAIAALLLFLTLWFHPGGSFMTAVIGAAVLGGVGFVALRSKPDAAH
jgi:FtsH-binding integral membrane protein